MRRVRIQITLAGFNNPWSQYYGQPGITLYTVPSYNSGVLIYTVFQYRRTGFLKYNCTLIIPCYFRDSSTLKFNSGQCSIYIKCWKTQFPTV